VVFGAAFPLTFDLWFSGLAFGPTRLIAAARRGFFLRKGGVFRRERVGSAFRARRTRAPHGAADHGWLQKRPVGNVAGVVHDACGCRIEGPRGVPGQAMGARQGRSGRRAAHSDNARRQAGPITITGRPRPPVRGRTPTSTSTMATPTATMTPTTTTWRCRCFELR